MADDELRTADRGAPAIMRVSWDVALAAGLWWPFENAAILSERPAELHVNDRKLFHRGNDPAAVYRDGWRVYAWNGKAVPERWITEPETVPGASSPVSMRLFESTSNRASPSRRQRRGSARGPRRFPKPGLTLWCRARNDLPRALSIPQSRLSRATGPRTRGAGPR